MHDKEKSEDISLIKKSINDMKEDWNEAVNKVKDYFSEEGLENLKEAGFTMAFIGESSRGDNLVHVGDNKFLLHRFVIVNYTTMNDLNRYFGGIK